MDVTSSSCYPPKREMSIGSFFPPHTRALVGRDTTRPEKIALLRANSQLQIFGYQVITSNFVNESHCNREIYEPEDLASQKGKFILLVPFFRSPVSKSRLRSKHISCDIQTSEPRTVAFDICLCDFQQEQMTVVPSSIANSLPPNSGREKLGNKKLKSTSLHSSKVS